MDAYEFVNTLSNEKPRQLPEVTEILNQARDVQHQLEHGIFEENEHGSLRIHPSTKSFPAESASKVDQIDVIFVHPRAAVRSAQQLGCIERDPNKPGIGYAYAQRKIDGKLVNESIGPDDERWEVIVGSIERAIATVNGI